MVGRGGGVIGYLLLILRGGALMGLGGVYRRSKRLATDN
jgi:hypothetical protein